LQVSLPPGVTWTSPLSLLGSNPAPALLSGLVIPASNIKPFAASLNAGLAISSDSTSASLGVPNSTGATAAWSYALSGSYYVASQLSVPVSTANLTATHNLQFANVKWNQNKTLEPVINFAGKFASDLPA
jgi:hypothetical protein